MKRRPLTPEEQLWQQVWPDAMKYEHIDMPFEAPFRRASRSLLKRNNRGRSLA
ncbi:MAG: hypothetical protein ACREGB_02385 [Candidatus Saccharimonadales bacterium]